LGGKGMKVLRRYLATQMAVLLIVSSGTATAAGAETHVFDPVLSLTGSCETSEIDPVEDPGCPEDIPPAPLVSPRSVVADSQGDIYVASYGAENLEGAEGRIDVFDSNGVFITEIPDSSGPKNLAVDSKGNLYVLDYRPGVAREIVRYEPTLYKPAAGEIAYGNPPKGIEAPDADFVTGLGLNRANDHLFVHFGGYIAEYGSAAEENKLLEKFGQSDFSFTGRGVSIAIDAAHERIYADDKNVVRVFELAPPHKLLPTTIEGSVAPKGEFANKLALAVDETTGHLFVYDGEGAKAVFEFTESGEFVSTIKHSFQYTFGAEIGVDNGPTSPNMGNLYVPSEANGKGHSFAFEPRPPACSPELESISASEITQDQARLEAKINPCNAETHFIFEYTTQESFEEEEFAGALTAGEGQIAGGGIGVPVSSVASNLEAETAYRYRVVAENECEIGSCRDEGEGGFTTYLTPEASPPCSNDPLRIGFSAALPDCRAYELVTPPDTNARPPRGLGRLGILGILFTTREASPAGGAVSFFTEGGAIPGSEGTGALGGDPYLATRKPTGWATTSAGPTGGESSAPLPGSVSPDQGYSFWEAGGEGSALLGGKLTTYVRYPDGHSALVGRGSLGTDPEAEGELISENGGHIIFVSSTALGHVPVQLEENAPPGGTAAIYDRTADEVTHVISLLPGNVTPAAGQNALYAGASLDGRSVAFKVGNTLYLRYHNEETYEIGEGLTFAGIAEGGGRIFYLKGGDLFRFDAATEEVTRLSESGDVTVVNVSADGNTAYLVSPSVLTGEENPSGDTAQAGKENLYLSREGVLAFVGTLTERDVEGESTGSAVEVALGSWVEVVGSGRLGADPSRTTPDGGVLLFESSAHLTGYDSEGHIEVYRYDFSGKTLDCLSCVPTKTPATGKATLQSVLVVLGGPEPFTSFVLVHNLSLDGRRAFFQSTEPLVVNDTDGLQDVYEWEAQGVGTCKRSGGCIYLISSGHSNRTDYLYAVSDSGDNVFFRSADLLLRSDVDATPSIYDARVDGGFPEEAVVNCTSSETCGGPLEPPPVFPPPASGASRAPEEPQPRTCPKGKRLVKRQGKTLCVKRHRKHHHRAGAKKKGAGK
jgi:hypothetical protein